MFTPNQLKKQKTEILLAKSNREGQAALASIVRSNIEKFISCSTQNRVKWLMSLNFSPSLISEISKEIAVYKYNARKNG